MADNISIIKKHTIESSKAIIKDKLNFDFNRLKSEALKFLTSLNTIYLSGNLVRTHKNGNNEIMRLWTLYRDANTSQALALIKNTFALALDAYLGRTIILTYVDDNGNVILYTEEGEIEILQKVGKNAGRENFGSAIKGKAIKGKPGVREYPDQYKDFALEEGDLVHMVQDSAAKRKSIYAEGIKRYNQMTKPSKDHPSRPSNETKRYYYEFIKNKFTFPENSFSRGEIAEAYVNAIIENKYVLGEINNALRELYDIYISGHKDSIGAIEKGDVLVTADGKVSLAVKGNSASTAKIGQYIVAAWQIAHMESPPEEGIQKWLENLKGIDVMAKEIEQEAKEKGREVAFEEILNNFVLTK